MQSRTHQMDWKMFLLVLGTPLNINQIAFDANSHIEDGEMLLRNMQKLQSNTINKSMILR